MFLGVVGALIPGVGSYLVRFDLRVACFQIGLQIALRGVSIPGCISLWRFHSGPCSWYADGFMAMASMVLGSLPVLGMILR